MVWSWASLPLLLLTTWSSGHGEQAFKCYTCEKPVSIFSCKSVVYCKPKDTACKTTLITVESEYPFNGKPVVTGSCSTSCEATDPDSIGAAQPVFCCFHDLCNAAGAIPRDTWSRWTAGRGSRSLPDKASDGPLPLPELSDNEEERHLKLDPKISEQGTFTLSLPSDPGGLGSMSFQGLVLDLPKGFSGVGEVVCLWLHVHDLALPNKGPTASSFKTAGKRSLPEVEEAVLVGRPLQGCWPPHILPPNLPRPPVTTLDLSSSLSPIRSEAPARTP
ncbi:PREDICTED: uncharacterized protein LOC102816768 [Chrysochloris asiatica]|uniref:Uncharacterized protein LOC102816768 n=1 Tax=Chrysochloris asiatica TaxID=185453 RepID=A0A9B0T481_CHRAS|nr:PREDICTED: uncharacterized protein LOC102816768 [Chrysochloris asiatica]